MHIPALVAALAAAPLLAAAGMYREPVIELDAKSFKKVMANEHASMVAFVAPWCGHCQNLAPEYTAAAKSLSPLIPFYSVDCDAQANKPLCAEYGIKGFPSVKAFPRASKGAARDYNGERKRGDLIEYAKTLVPDRVKKLRADDGVEVVIDRFLGEKPKLPHALLVHPKAPSIPFLWKVLGHRLTGKAMLGFIKDTPSHGVLTGLNLDAGEDGARLLFWEKGAERPSVIEYQGELKFNALLEWLEVAIQGEIPTAEPVKREPKASESTTQATESSAAAAAESAAAAEEAAARRAKLQAKMDEAERRDRLRREKLAAKRQAEDEAQGGTPVEEAAAEPADVVGEEVTSETAEAEYAGREREVVENGEEGTPVEDAPAAEPAEGAEGAEEDWKFLEEEEEEVKPGRDEL